MTLDCQQACDRLDDLVDELLAAEERSDVEQHLIGCDACREELADLERLLAKTRSLPREIEPARNLWPGIESRLTPRRSFRLMELLPDWSDLFAPQGLAAMAAAVAVVAIGLLWVRDDRDGSTTEPVRAELAAIESPERVAQRAELARSEDGVLLARQNLLEAVEGPKEHLSPETVAVIEENMRLIDQAIGQIRSALDEDPLNHQLNMLLAAQYQREAELLKRVSGV